MILYFGGSANLYGQPIASNPALLDAITTSVPASTLDTKGRLISNGEFFRVELQALDHVCEIEEGHLKESMAIRVMDYTNALSSDDAEEVFSTSVLFSPARFEGLVNTPDERAKRDRGLLKAANELQAEVSGS